MTSRNNSHKNNSRRQIRSVLLLGSSALKIGEAGEFDYSGSQAIKALKEEGIRVILINPNIATIQTSENLADEVYFLPVKSSFVERVIVKEKPDGVLLGFGGQTALNCGIDLYKRGIFEKHGVEILGAPMEAVLDTEDRKRFVTRLDEINVNTPRSREAHTIDEAIEASREIGFPCMMRVAFALGGLGSGLCNNEDELRKLVTRAFAHTDQVLVEEYLLGWKEIEYEIVRDDADNCITVCNMENLNPMGVHTGESIVVAPSQTLTDKEYHSLREIGIRTVRHLGIVGECNIQYAFSPTGEGYRVIEINSRLSRSSALASKATGYPLAFVAAKIALGQLLPNIKNSVTDATNACFEPALDYVVVKAPRWDLKKFKGVTEQIGSSMKSVGEVMSIGRTFGEAIQKALRMLQTGAFGAVVNPRIQIEDLQEELKNPTELHIFAISEALSSGMTVDEINKITHVDPWFVHQINRLVLLAKDLESKHFDELDTQTLIKAKRSGFSDHQIGICVDVHEDKIRELRHKLDIRPSVKQIDTLAGEYPAVTNYLYLTYHGQEDDVTFEEIGGVTILGPGAYRIGSSVEFDWCCVTTAQTLRSLGYRTIMVNHNPETVSTDYDECDRLYFDELSFEVVSEIYDKETPLGLILSMGGQIPNNLAMRCHKAGMRALGTSPVDLDRAEDRQKFSALLEELEIPQPAWRELKTIEEAFSFAEDVGYPVLVRPSYVLSGAAMAVALNDNELRSFLEKAADISPDHPVVISKFIQNAKEIDVDAVSRDGKVICWAVSEHVENAGVHSGDATLVLPPQRTYFETMRQIRRITDVVAENLRINGPFNIQFLAKNNNVMVIECNVRASRSFPFVSKVLKNNFIETATKVIMGRPVEKTNNTFFDLDYVAVKAPEFSFTRLEGADPTLGVEMASTGEVACMGEDFNEAFLKALISVGFRFPIKGVLLSTGPIESKAAFLESAHLLHGIGVEFFATEGTAKFLIKNDLPCTALDWPLTGQSPTAVDIIREKKVNLVINIPKDDHKDELTNGYMIRRAAVDFGVPLITNLQIAQRLCEALAYSDVENLAVKSWSSY
ncbi:carbamoyl-phosphate synthase (glutamine-hydrolyzing) large subunit [bacterium AH-315-J21]|nr:carbamoyl-phosphate synthase (glutamine-hydrolyzing) large subunit [bacterium AH-315-J21]